MLDLSRPAFMTLPETNVIYTSFHVANQDYSYVPSEPEEVAKGALYGTQPTQMGGLGFCRRF